MIRRRPPPIHSRALGSILLFFQICVVCVNPRPIFRAHAQTAPPPDPRFGLVNAYAAPDATAELGIGWEQITFDWRLFQPHRPDEFLTGSVDTAWLDDAARAHREVVGLIINTPAWASASGERFAVPDGLDLPASDPGNVWAAFVARLVAYYAPRGIHRWIISDQPDIQRGEGRVNFAGGVGDYAALVRAAHLAATIVDPGTQIHLAGMNGFVDSAAGREPYLARLLRLLKNDSGSAYGYYFDVVMVRAFDSTQTVLDQITQTRAILDAADMSGKPLWLVTNASPTDDPLIPAGSPLFSITSDQQADFIVQAAAISVALGVERIAIDRLADPPTPPHAQGFLGSAINWLISRSDEPPAWGLIRADGSRRPAFDAYRAVITLFAGTTAVEWHADSAADLVVLGQADRDIYVMWMRGARSGSFVVTSGQVGETATYYDSYRASGETISAAVEWPAAFTIAAPAARIDANGFLTVAGSPRLLVLDRSDFYRVVYLDTANNERARLR
jgi:hypothetical protein